MTKTATSRQYMEVNDDFDAVYHREFAYVWRTLGRLGVPQADLADGVHDVFVVVYRRWAEIDPARPIRPWLFGIARKTAASRRRKDRDVVSDEIEPTAATDDRAAQRDLLWRMLAELDEDRRAVVILHDIEGHTGADIARMLGIPANTVHSRLRLARAELRALVAAEQDAPIAGESERRAIAVRVATTLGITMAAARTASAAGSGAAASVGATSIAMKLVALAMVVGVAGGAAVIVERHTREARAQRVTAASAVVERARPEAKLEPQPEPKPQLQLQAQPQPQRQPEPKPPPRAEARPTPQRAAPSDSSALLASALAALQRDDGTRALALIARDERENPSSALAEERDALRIDALLQLGRTGDARGAAEEFAAHYPHTMHRDLLERALAEPR